MYRGLGALLCIASLLLGVQYIIRQKDTYSSLSYFAISQENITTKIGHTIIATLPSKTKTDPLYSHWESEAPKRPNPSAALYSSTQTAQSTMTGVAQNSPTPTQNNTLNMAIQAILTGTSLVLQVHVYNESDIPVTGAQGTVNHEVLPPTDTNGNTSITIPQVAQGDEFSITETYQTFILTNSISIG